MSAVFFQAVGKSAFAVVCSLVRDIVCFIPLVIILPKFFNPGIKGILFAAPVADLVAGCIAVIFTIIFFKQFNKINDSSKKNIEE
jgi:Na+-driven multidrug efflux pump